MHALRSSRAARTALVAVPGALAALIAGGLGIDRHGLTTGEAATMYAARLTLPQFEHLIRHVDLVHATYYASMHVLIELGGGTLVLRLVSLVATVLAAGLIGVLGSRLSGSIVSGALAGLAFALCPTVDGFAKTARSYGVLPLLVVLTLLAFVHAARTTSRRSWVLFGIMLLITVYVHELSLLLIAAFAVVLVMLRARRAEWTNWLAVSVVVCILAAPLVYYSHKEDQAVKWIKAPGWEGFAVTARTWTGPSPVAMIVFGVGAVAALIAGAFAWRRTTRSTVNFEPPGDVSVLTLALPVVVVPALLLIVESAVSTPLFNFRYVSYYEPAVVILVAHGWTCLGRALATAVTRGSRGASAGVIGAAVIGVAGLVIALVAQLSLLQKLTTPLGYKENYGSIERHILAGRRPGDGILYIPRNLHYLPDAYPRLRRLDDIAQSRTPTASGNYQGHSHPLPLVLRRLSRLERVWVVHRSGSAVTPPLKAEGDLLQRKFRRVHQWPENGLTLSLWVRRHT